MKSRRKSGRVQRNTCSEIESGWGKGGERLRDTRVGGEEEKRDRLTQRENGRDRLSR